MNQPRHLLTTADQATWKFDRPVIFLGEWCKLYDQKTIWERMNAITAAPYGLGKVCKDSDNAEARALECKLFPRVCNLLNNHHGTRHSERYWRIILGNWFNRIINVFINRIMTLQQCLDLYTISGTSVYSNENYSLAPQDSLSSIYAFNDDYWNNALNERILHLTKNQHLITDYINEDVKNRFSLESKPYKLVSRLKISREVKSKCREILSAISGMATQETDAFITATYLTKIVGVKLMLSLGQLPRKWNSPNFKSFGKPNSQNRKYLGKQLEKSAVDHKEKVISALLFEVMPVCFLETYDEIKNHTMNLPWPSKPRFIFTSNRFDTDEIFKFWCASKVELGTKYFIGQHGNYGVTRININPSNEEIVSDKFITWGWSDGLPQHTPAFILKSAGIKPNQFNTHGGLLLIQVTLDHRINTFDSTYEFQSYFCDQQEFCSKVSDQIVSSLTIRLHAASKYQRWNEEARWREFNPNIKIDAGNTSIRKLCKNSRLIVHSYDSTGILETLSLNIPTLAFWQNGLDHLRENAIPYYQLLIDAGIVHLSAESVALKVNTVWDDVEQWWRQAKVQNARRQFCEKYARHSANPVGDLLKILNTT
jgi:putative transferase (TIGR04331 family)